MAEAEEFKEDLNVLTICPDCRSIPPRLVEEFSSGDMVCSDCGLVVGERIIDTRSEWRTFANDDQGNDDPSRVGDSVNPLLDGSQLETSIAFSEQKSHKALSRLQNQTVQDKSTKGLMQAYKEIGTLCETMNMGTKVANAAKHIFKVVDETKKLKSKPLDVLVAGCIFIACRQQNVPRTFQEIFQLTKVSKKDIGRIFKQLEAILQKLAEEQKADPTGLAVNSYTSANSTDPSELCGRFCSQLSFKQTQKIVNISRSICQFTASDEKLSGRSPLSTASLAIYFTCHALGEPRTAKEIAVVAGVSDGTIKTGYKNLHDRRDFILPSDWIVANKLNLDLLPGV